MGENIQNKKMTKEEIIARWYDFKDSQERANMKIGYKYFSGHNTYIEERKRKVYFPDKYGELQEKDSLLVNNKLCHNFLGKLVNQKVSYGLAKNFVLDYVNEEDKERFVALNKKLNKSYLTKRFYSTLKTVGADSRIAGRGILYRYYENNVLKFLRLDPTECCLVWEDDLTKEKLDSLIRGYEKIDYTGGKKTIVRYIVCYEKDGFRVFRNFEDEKYDKKDNIDFTKWIDAGELAWGYKLKDGKKEIITYEELPFVVLKNGFEMKQDLSAIKSLIDDYDLICSENSNDICNVPNSVKVVKGYNGDSKDEFIRNMAFYNTVFLDEDGDMTGIETPIAIDQTDIHLTRLRRDIFEFGCGVDTVNRELNDVSGIALKELYADLDSEFNNWACFISDALQRIISFMIYDIKAKTKEDYSDIVFDIVYNTDMIINEKEIAEIAQLYKGILSPETLATNATWTKDADKEVKGLREQAEFDSKLAGEAKQKAQATNEHNMTAKVTGN